MAYLLAREDPVEGGEITLKAGNTADQGNQWANEAVVQSNWNDSDPVD